MFRTCLSTSTRTLASSSSHTPTSLFHTSTSAFAQVTKRKGSAQLKKANIAKIQKREQQALLDQPSVVLGTRPNQESTKWASCDLAKVLVNEAELRATTNLPIHEEHLVGSIEVPKQLGFGVGKEEKKMLFDELPLASAHMSVAGRPKREQRDPELMGRIFVEEQDGELRKAGLVARALDLRNANAAGIAFENRRRIIEAFSTPENPYNTGRTEVQAALLTYKIRNLWTHLTTFKRDVGNRRALRQLVHQRAKILRYLKSVDQDRYDIVLERLGLEPEAVEGELVV